VSEEEGGQPEKNYEQPHFLQPVHFILKEETLEDFKNGFLVLDIKVTS
jgi:hypothetical protein